MLIISQNKQIVVRDFAAASVFKNQQGGIPESARNPIVLAIYALNGEEFWMGRFKNHQRAKEVMQEIIKLSFRDEAEKEIYYIPVE